MENQGLIKVHSLSPYERLDPSTAEWLEHLKQMWPLWKKNTAITEMLIKFFSQCQDPYKSALKITVSSGDFYAGKQNSLAYHIMETFSNWTKCVNPGEIPEYLKVDAMNIMTKQKNYALVKLVVDTYKMVESKEILIDPIMQLARSKKYKEACHLACLLNLHDNFGIEEFLVPLVFQDKYVIVEPFLEESKKHQVELAVFLDDLIGKRSVTNEAQAIIVCLNIHDARLRGLSYKPLSKLLSRIMKRFNIPATTCPNLTQKRGKGILQFLMHKRYVEKTIGGESWSEMVLEAIGDDENLQLELVENVALYGDLKEALSWAERFSIPQKMWPRNLLEFKAREKENGSFRQEEETWWPEPAVKRESPSLKYHKLPIEESRIKVIDTQRGFTDFLADLSKVSLIGIDAEWKPSFGIKKCDLALIQIATLDLIYIIDVMTLAEAASPALWEKFATILFECPNILKLGFGINTDLLIVKETFRKIHGIKTGPDVGFLDLGLLWKTLVDEYRFVFPYRTNSKASENLNSLIEMCLGESLDKSDQFSNWENRPLRRGQILYAALDAYCLLEAYNVIVKECESQNIPVSDIVEEIVFKTVTKKTTTKRKKGGKTHFTSERRAA